MATLPKGQAPNKPARGPRSIARDLTFGLLLCMSLALTITLSIIYTSQSNKMLGEVEHKADEYISTLTRMAEVPLWNFDQQVLDQIVEVFVKNDDVVRAGIVDSQGNVMVVYGKEGLTEDINREAEIRYLNRVIGHAHIVLSLQRYKKDLRNFLIIMIGVFLIFTVIIYLATGVLLRMVLNRPLNSLYRSMDRVATGDYSHAFEGVRHNELSEIVNRFQAMTDQVQGRENRLQTVNQALKAEMKERRKAEQAMLESEARYRSVFENAGAAMVIIESDLEVSLINSTFESMSGYARQEVEWKRKWTDFVHQDDLDRMMAFLADQEHETSAGSRELEFKCVGRFGGVAEVIMRISIVPGTDRLVASLTDITARKRAEENLRKSEQTLKTILDTSPIGIALIRNGRFQWGNQALCDITGISSINLAGRELFSVWESSETAEKVLVRINESIELSGAFSGDEVWVGNDGFRRFCHVEARPNPSGELDAELVLAVMDITKRKQAEDALKISEQRLKYALEGSNDGMWDYNPKNGSVYYSPRWFSMLGYQPDSMAHAFFTWQRLLHPDDRKQAEAFIAQQVVGGGSFFSLEFRMRKAGGGYKWIMSRGKAVEWDEQGSVLRMVGTHTDITEQKRVEQKLANINVHLDSEVKARTRDLQEKAKELEDANTRLKELDEMKSAFLSSVSHELRTPLTSIFGFAKLINKDFLRFFNPLAKNDDKLERQGLRIRENLNIIIQEGDRLTRLINDVLDLSKIESAQVVWRDEEVDPVHLVDQAVRAVGGELQTKKRLGISIETEESMPRLWVDPDRLFQTLINLIGNAIKFTEHGEVSIKVRAIGKEAVRFSITDTGIGIPEEDLPNVFDKFHQVKQMDTLSKKPHGTGLGLAICKQIVEHYGGSIWAESEMGVGSAFHFELPVAVSTAVSDHTLQ